MLFRSCNLINACEDFEKDTIDTSKDKAEKPPGNGNQGFTSQENRPQILFPKSINQVKVILRSRQGLLRPKQRTSQAEAKESSADTAARWWAEQDSDDEDQPEPGASSVPEDSLQLRQARKLLSRDNTNNGVPLATSRIEKTSSLR